MAIPLLGLRLLSFPKVGTITSDGLQPNRDVLEPRTDGLLPKVSTIDGC